MQKQPYVVNDYSMSRKKLEIQILTFFKDGESKRLPIKT